MQQAKPDLKKLRPLLTAVFIFFQFVLGVIGFVIWSSDNPDKGIFSAPIPDSTMLFDDPLILILGLFAFAAGVLSLLVPRLVTLAMGGKATVMTEEEMQFNVFVITLALREMIGVFGFIIGIAKSNPWLPLPFLLVALIAIVALATPSNPPSPFANR